MSDRKTKIDTEFQKMIEMDCEHPYENVQLIEIKRYLTITVIEQECDNCYTKMRIEIIND